jgi:hypothetical protein
MNSKSKMSLSHSADNRLKAWGLAEAILRPSSRPLPDEWARLKRVYPEILGLPGLRDPSITPYVIPVVRAVHAGHHKRIVMLCGAQMGKTDEILDIIGCLICSNEVPAGFDSDSYPLKS